MLAARTGIAAAALLVGVSTAQAAELAPEKVEFVDGQVAQSLTGKPGDVAEGRKFFADRKLGNCLACHVNSEMTEQQFHGEVGPPLDGVADRWTEADLRAIVVNSKAVFGEQTVMPGFYSLEVGANVRKDLVGKTILTAEQVESIVAYLGTLK
ncbi:MAG: sulfur oxidation c-type cytochrome SoxX [Kiloniellaceae bacterium]